MSKKDKDERKHRLVTMVLTHVRDDGTVDLSWDDQVDMSSATFFRAMKDLEGEAFVGRLARGVYMSAVPPARLASDPEMKSMLKMATFFYSFMDAAAEFQDQFFAEMMEVIRYKRDRCMACDSYKECFDGKIQECPHCKIGEIGETRAADYMEAFRKSILSREKFSGENHVSDPTPSSGSDPEEETLLSRENKSDGELPPPEEEDPAEVPPDGPGCTRVQERPDPRALMRRGLEDAKKARREKVATPRQQLNEVKKVWIDGIKARCGSDFKVARWGGKEHKLVPELLKSYGLELTKSGMLLYLKQWDKLKAENAWIKEDIPTVGLLWHFREVVFAAAQGKGRIGERAAQRTADEYDDEDGTNNGAWPSRAPEAPPAT